jgi:STE24 endopeptidase
MTADLSSNEPHAAEPTPGASDQMTPAQLDEAWRYGRAELICSLLDKAIDVAFLAMMAFAFARPLDEFLSRSIHRAGIRLAAMYVIVVGLHAAISFPLSLYSGFILEHRFGLSRQSFARWLWRYVKRNLLAIVFGLALFEGLYAVIWYAGANWWWIAAAGFFVVSVVLGQLAPVLILPLFYKIERIDAAADPKVAELLRRLSRLAQGTSLSIEGVYRMNLSSETVKANAMLAGLGRTRRVILGDTLLDQFSPEEIEVVFAHEIGHHVHRHIVKLIGLGVLLSTLGFWLCDRLLTAWAGIGPSGAAYSDVPVASLPLLMFALTLFSLLLEPLQNVISRHFERQCDRYALQTTGLREAYLSAFRKLAKINKDDPNPNPIEVFLFHSHPPISERLEMAGTVK